MNNRSDIIFDSDQDLTNVLSNKPYLKKIVEITMRLCSYFSDWYNMYLIKKVVETI